MVQIDEIMGKRAQLVEDQRKMLDLADAENRELTADEEAIYQQMDVDFDAFTDEIKNLELIELKKLDRAIKLEEREELLKQSKNAPIKPEPGGDNLPAEKRDEKQIQEIRQAFRSYLIRGSENLSKEEKRALQADSDTAGGYLVAPENFVADLIKDLENAVFVRSRAKVISLPTAASFGVPELANRIGDPTWTAEIKIGSEDTTMDFAKRTMTPHPLARYIKVSKKLLRVAQINVEAEIRTGLAYEFATAEENAFLNGTGSNQPLGVMVASDYGVSTSRDVSTGNTTTQIKADNLIECVYTLKAQYRKNARWAFHRDAVKAIRKLKTGEGDYIWQSGIASDKPATILGYPYDESEYMPNTFTTGLYVGILANWGYYWIADALDMQIQVLLELYAATNQNGYIARKETDGAPVHENGFVRVKLA